MVHDLCIAEIEDLWFATAWRFRSLLTTGEYRLVPLEQFAQHWKPWKSQGGNMEKRMLIIQMKVKMWISLIVFYSHSLHMVSDYQPSQNTPVMNPFMNQDPQILLRHWCKCSYTAFDAEYGFRCSNWRACQPANHFEDLRDDVSISLDHVRNHCQGTDAPSCYISASDHVSWMYGKTRKKYPDGLCTECWREVSIAFISVEKLARLSIPYDRSDNRVKVVGGKLYTSTNQNGVKFAWDKHWLIYGWIPMMCITEILTAKDFWNLSEAVRDLDSKCTICC